MRLKDLNELILKLPEGFIMVELDWKLNTMEICKKSSDAR